MTAAEALGLPLPGAGDIGQPVAALVVVKYFDPDAEAGVGHRALATEGLSVVEAYGMAGYAVEKLREALSG